MATHKSAEKRARQSIRRAKRNDQTKGAVRTFEKKVRTAIAAGDKKGAQEMMDGYISKITKAATKGVLHAKSASRKISRLATRVSQIGASK